MKRILLLTGLLCSAGVSGAPTQTTSIKFDDAPASAPPPGWIATLTGKGAPKWTVEKDVTAGVWHTLRVDFQGSSFVVSFNGEAVIKAVDTTFPDAGKVGLWTKADSVTLFDDFSFGGK